MRAPSRGGDMLRTASEASRAVANLSGAVSMKIAKSGWVAPGQYITRLVVAAERGSFKRHGEGVEQQVVRPTQVVGPEETVDGTGD
jgi:hypothetical protein